MGKSTISMAIFNSYFLKNQWVDLRRKKHRLSGSMATQTLMNRFPKTSR
jgi:hypothetical protein